MKKVIYLILAGAVLMVFFSCVKNLESLIQPELPTQAEPTPVGDPIGAIVTKNIGKSGGSIKSADGNTELVFPADALAENTDISVQAVTNNAPNGVGNAYSFLPDGIQFNQPVLLKLHYTAEDLAATLADLMGIAFQGHDGIWYRVSSFTNDTINKVISAPIKHFTPYTKFDVLIINPTFDNVKVNKTRDLHLDIVSANDDELTSLGPQGGEDLAPLIKLNSKNVTWSVNSSVNGSATYGFVSGTNQYTTFKAPAKAPSRNQVTVTALVDVSFKFNGKNVAKPTLISNIKIIDGEKYSLQIYLKQSGGIVTYTDSATMIVSISSDDVVTISDIKNYAPNALPAVVSEAGCTYTYLPEGIGEMNITSVTGSTTAPFGDPSRTLLLLFTHSSAISPASNVSCPGEDDYVQGGIPNQGDPGDISFALLPSGGVWNTTDGELTGVLTLLNGVH
jgi:hypothetical protein